MRRIALAILVAISIAACTKKTGEAIVVFKEHIDAREESPSPTPSNDKPAKEEQPVCIERQLAPDEIDVDGFVMKKNLRGTSKDPRAATDEQWRVTVELTSGGRTLIVRTDRAHYDKLKKGDRVKVRYSEGNYTGTVWGADLVD